jgi:magnesium transporter
VQLSILDETGESLDLGIAAVEERLAAGTPFWVDVDDPDDATVDRLAAIFGWHPLASEDSRTFGQRPKFDAFDGYVLIVAFAAIDDGDDLAEVHLYYSEHWMVSVRRGPCPPLDAMRSSPRSRSSIHERGLTLYRLLEAMASSFGPALDVIEERATELETQIFADPDPDQLEEVWVLKRRVHRMRRAIAPGRDVIARGSTVIAEGIPGVGPELQRYLHDLYSHLVHLTDEVDAEREHLAGVMDVYLSMINNRQNDTMKQLTAVSTIFLPLTFLTGFFGMNFPDLVQSIGGWPAFLLLGIGLNLAAAALTVTVLRHRGWWT